MRDEHLSEGNSALCLMSCGVPVLLTGTTTETTLGTVVVPANIIGPHSCFKITTWWQMTNNANVKTVRHRCNGAVYGPGVTLPNIATATMMSMGINRGNVQSQIWNQSLNVPYIASTNGAITSTLDLTQDLPWTITGQLAVGTDSLTLDAWTFEILNPLKR